MKRNISRLLILSSFCLLAPVLVAVVAGAGTVQIGGSGQLVPICNGQTSFFTMVLTGSLTGCWYADTPTSSITPSGLYQERGTELFVGCLLGPTSGCGSFQTTYKFTGKYAPTGEEIHGRCEHKIVLGSGTGVFDDASGRVDFKDDVANAIFYYRGHIMLDAPNAVHVQSLVAQYQESESEQEGC